MTATLANITVDCADVRRTAGFWAQVLDREIGDRASDYFAALPAHRPGEPTWLFIKVPEAKTAKNRLHVDLTAADCDAEVARLIELGASKVAEHSEYGMSWVVMTDPEGNEFCLGRADSR